MSGTEAHLEELSALAARLRSGAEALDGIAPPPPAPQAGTPSEAITGAVSMLALSAAGVVDGMNAIADEVASGRDVYDETDTANADEFTKHSPFRPR